MKTGKYNLKPSACSSWATLITLCVGLAPCHAQATDRLVGPPFFDTGGAIDVWGGSVVIANTSFMANRASSSGGALFLTTAESDTSQSNFTDNTAKHDGGAIYRNSPGELSIVESVFQSNSATRGGAVADEIGPETAAVALSQMTTIVDRSGFTHNEAKGDSGGAFYRIGNGRLHVVNSTFSGNRASTEGGALFSDPNGDLSIVHSTLVGNHASGSPNLAGGGFTSYGDTTVLYSILSSNTPTDCASPLAVLTGTGNLAGGCTSSQGADFNRGDVTHLGSLGGLLGTRPIHDLLVGSNAIDLGLPVCRDPIVGAALTQDQIGRNRPFDGNKDGVARCDVGAIEYSVLVAPRGDLEVGLENR